ncbi:MAG: response regulator [Anaerolineae bacterium]|nr:response regulator [Anaerolineae bacterium]
MSNESPLGSRALVIDDDPSLQTLVGMLLGRVGIQITSAETAVEGIRLLNEEDFDIMILDLMLPDMDGLELLAALRQDDRFDNLPVLILSARVDPEAISKALESGADGYLTKPYLPHSLTQRVMSILSQGRKKTQPPTTG